MMRRFSLKAAVLAGVLLLGALIPALAQQQRGPGVVGDVNGDGRITSADALAVYAYLAGRPIPATFDVPGRGDADGDGRITRADAELIMRVAVGQAAGDRPVGKPADPTAPPAEGPLRLQCVADVRAQSVRCSEPGAATPGGVQADRIVYGGQHVYVSLLTSNVTTQADTFAFDMSVKNLIPQAIGTNDGINVDPVKVFFASEPQNTSNPPSNGTVTAANHNGSEAFTTSEPQKFFEYAEIIQPGATSSVKRWKLRRDPGVQSFQFFLYVSSPVVHAKGWVDVYPDSAVLSAGATLQLSDTVRSALGRPIPGATSTWSSANPSVATVSSNGIVTAMADGTVEITASSAPRSPGKMTLVVRTASVDSSTIKASPASLPVHDTSSITVQLRSANGTPITNSGGTVVLSASAGTITAVTDNNNGTYSARVTSTAVGVVKVSGTLNGNAFRDTAQVTFTPGAAAGYVVTSSASSVAAGSPVTITAQTVDAHGNAVAAAGTKVGWSSTNGGSFASDTTLTDAAGAATVVFTTSTTAGVTHTVTATDPAGRTGTSGNIVTQVGAAAKLAVVQQPTNTTAGSSVSPAVTVAIQDANGNTVTSATDSVSVSIGTNPGSGTLSGTTKVAAVNGVATFSNLSIDKAGTGYTLSFTSGSLTAATSNAFNVTAGAASKLVLVTQPSDTARSGAAFPRQPVVQLQDANGNAVAQAGVTVTAAIATGGGTLGGTATANTSASGTATFTDLSISGTVGDRTLSFSAGSLTGVSSNTVAVRAGAASQLIFSVQPSNTAAGASITPAVQVTVADASGNVVAGYTDSVTVAIGANPSSGTLSGTRKVAPVNGVATFSDLSINKSGTGYTLGASSGSLAGTSAAFNVTAGAASHTTSTITANPASIVADGTSTSTITVQLKDDNGNNLTASGGTVEVAAGMGTISATTDNNNGTYTATLTSSTTVANSVQITAKLNGSNLTNVATVAFTPGAAAAYVVDRSDATPVAGGSVTISAQLVDANGNAVPTSGRTVTWSSTNGGSFASATSQTNSSGVATVVFTTSTTAGTVHTVTANDGSVSGTSGSITTQVGAAAKLGFVQQPSNTAAGASITPAVTVAIQDANGNTVTTATDNVTIAIGTNPSSGTLSGTATVAAVNGVATFSNLSINKAGTGYTLAASSGSLTAATSNAFDITPGAPAALAFTVQPSNVVASATITPAVQVSITDAFGNLVTTATDNVTLAIGTNPSGGTLSGTTTVAAVSGVATFSNLSINLVGTGYTLAASSGSLTGATSSAFNVTHGPLHHFLVEAAGGGSIGAQLAGTPFNVRVTAQDEFNNTVTSFTGTVGFTSTPAGGISAGGTSGAFTAGVLTSHSITFGTAGTFTLTATRTSGTEAGTSNSFDVQAPPTAVNEGPAANSTPGQPFHAFYSTAGSPQAYTLAAPGLLSNDNLGFPSATITSFGADSLGGSVTTHAAGSTVSPLPGTGRTTGSLSVGADGSVTFTPPDGFTGNYVFRYRLTNARGTSDGQVTIAVGARPSAVNDTYSPQLVGNVPVNTATSTQFRVTTNDTGDGKVLAITGQSNGTASLNADSTFTFRPTAGYSGPASFSYTVTNGFGTSAAATVSLTVGTPIWFIDAAAAAGGDGRYDTRFNSLSSFAAINNGTGNNPAADDNIFLYAGTYAGPVTLLSGQKLIGQRATASLSSIAGVTWPADAGAEPAMSSASALDVTAAGGTAVTLANVGSATAANNTLRGFNFGNVTATGTALAGTSFGTLAISEVGINTNGRAMNLTTGTLSGSLTGLTSSAGAHNVALTTVGTNGTFNFGSGALSGATTAALSINGGNGSFTYAGTIANAAGFTIQDQARTGGTLTLSGQITATGNGISITNSNTNLGVTGTVVLSNTGNTIAPANSQTALTVTNTTIGSGGLMFRSISASSATNGIVLNNTGTLGGLTVSGTGSAGTGGVIQSTSGDAISLTSTVNPSLSYMTVQNNLGSGIRASAVSGLVLSNSTVNNNGDTNGGSEAGVLLLNMSGTNQISASTVSNSFEDNIRWTPSAGAQTLNLTNTTVGPNNATSGNSGVNIIGINTAIATLNVTGGTFTQNKSFGIGTSFSDQAAHTVNVSGATFTDNNMAIGLATTEDADVTFDIANNPSILRSKTNAIQVLAGATSTSASQIRGKIRNNVIGDNTVDSGARDGIGIAIEVNDDANAVVDVTGNNIKHTDQDGIFIQARDPNTGDGDAATAVADFTVTGNTVGTPDDNTAFPFFTVYGMRFESRHNTTVCLDLSGNTSSDVGGVGHFYLRQRNTTSVFKLERYTGSGTDDAAVANFVKAQNPYAGVTAAATHESTTGFTGVANGTCRTAP